MPDLYLEVRRMRNLEAAWRRVRGRGLLSASKEIRAEVAAFDEDSYSRLRSIQDRLKAGTFRFAAQKGVAKARPGKRSRPIVIAPVVNRVVQRAILQTLQNRCEAVRAVLMTPTSVGGIDGVDVAIAQVVNAISAGAIWCVRSDIPDFFTQIPKRPVMEFVRDSAGDDQLVDLFEQAMMVELENAVALGEDAKLFPLGEIGVAQGSALSPLIGNILLNRFDQELNGRGVTCIRYIDDFLIMAPSRSAALATFKSARRLLADLGLDAYDPADRPDKAMEGACADGFDFLGCRIVPGLIQPAASAQANLISNVRRILDDGIKSMIDARRGKNLIGHRHAQTLSHLDKVVKGWGDAFSFCTGRQVFEQLDRRIDAEIGRFAGKANRLIDVPDLRNRRRAMGVFALEDTPSRDRDRRLRLAPIVEL